VEGTYRPGQNLQRLSRKQLVRTGFKRGLQWICLREQHCMQDDLLNGCRLRGRLLLRGWIMPGSQIQRFVLHRGQQLSVACVHIFDLRRMRRMDSWRLVPQCVRRLSTRQASLREQRLRPLPVRPNLV
jgi:hypothetical protein